jgi:hypothetical protein
MLCIVSDQIRLANGNCGVMTLLGSDFYQNDGGVYRTHVVVNICDPVGKYISLLSQKLNEPREFYASFFNSLLACCICFLYGNCPTITNACAKGGARVEGFGVVQ